ncbi:MAG: hypothetical protein QOF61_768 [Acidobacteriota bacterium]|jgi:ribosomal protein L40E|nr:hypothetical protein [Acidobacteriota bacterium]
MLPIPNEARVCRRCGNVATDDAQRCPRCGGTFARAKTMRMLGWMIIGIGAFLAISMSVITFYVAQIMYHTSAPGTHAGFTGTPEMAFFIFALFGFIIFFGLASVVSGAWQVRHARPNRKLMFLLIGMGLLFIIIGRVVRFLHH